jgi:hypothetical protein
MAWRRQHLAALPLVVDRTERTLICIVAGMLLAFIGIFLLLSNVPAAKLRWLFGGE